MATQAEPSEHEQDKEVLKPPVLDGSYDVQSLGLIDRVLGDGKIRDGARQAISQLIATVNGDETPTKPQDPGPPPDPPPEDVPEPVPGGTTVEEKGSKPGENRPAPAPGKPERRSRE